MVVEYVHWVAGLFKRHGELSDLELLSLSSAHKVYPEAKLLLWTEQGSCTNAPPYVELSYLSEAELGQSYYESYKFKARLYDTTDIIRLQKLHEYGGLYIDSDVICLKPWQLLGETEKLCIAYIDSAKKYLCNGVLYAPKPGIKLITDWLELCKAVAYRRRNTRIAFDYFSAKLPAKELSDALAIDSRQGKVHPGWGLGSSKRLRSKCTKLPDWLYDAEFMHMLGLRPGDTIKPESYYAKILAYLVKALP